MSRLPSHPGTDEEPSRTSPTERPGLRSWTRILAVAVVLLVAGMIVLHVTGVVGPGSH